MLCCLNNQSYIIYQKYYIYIYHISDIRYHIPKIKYQIWQIRYHISDIIYRFCHIIYQRYDIYVYIYIYYIILWYIYILYIYITIHYITLYMHIWKAATKRSVPVPGTSPRSYSARTPGERYEESQEAPQDSEQGRSTSESLWHSIGYLYIYIYTIIM